MENLVEVGADGGLDEGKHLLVGGQVDGAGDGFDDDKGLGEGFGVSPDDDNGVDITFELGQRLREDLASCDEGVSGR